jgi:hypothetical protein
MPISREEFERGSFDLGLPIARLLESLSDSAYTVEEIRDLLAGALERDAPLEAVEEALERLVLQGHAERKEPYS